MQQPLPSDSVKDRTREQICLTLNRPLRVALERAAAEQERSVSAQARFILARALDPQREGVAA